MNFKQKLKWFTLIEMLIVIVIIWILAAAIFPKLWWAQARARDTARKSNLQQLATALVSYQIDHSQYIPWAHTIADIKSKLVTAWLDNVPIDPNPDRHNSWIEWLSTLSWQFLYTSIKKYWIDNNAFVIMAASETEWWSNRVVDWNNSIWTTNYDDFDEIVLCKDFQVWDTTHYVSGWTCTYNKNDDALRYIYKY